MLEGLTGLFDLYVLFMIVAGTTLGVIVGSLPGLSATMGIALLIPLTYPFEPLPALVFLGGVYCGAVYGGSIAAIIMGVPGTPAGVAMMYDGYTMTRKGLVVQALGADVVGSALGGLISVPILIVAAPAIARIALRFGPGELFMLSMLGVILIGSLTGNTIVKGLIAGGLGLLVSTIGITYEGSIRFTFGISEFYDGIPLIAAIIGLFAIPQLLRMVEDIYTGSTSLYSDVDLTGIAFLPLKEIKRLWKTILRCGVLGTGIGALPGAGTDIAAFLGYFEARRTSKHPQKFGTGIVDGVVGPEVANNGVTGGSLIPLLTLGIPGNAVTAVLLGGLLIQGLTPGVALFRDHADITYGFMFSLIIANIVFLIIGSRLVKYYGYILKVPFYILIPVVTIFCVVGSFAIRNSWFDVQVAILIGGIAYLANKIEIPMAPVVLALILGPIAESNLGLSMITAGARDMSLFMFLFTRPIVIILFIITVGLLVSTIKIQRRIKRELAKLEDELETSDNTTE